MLHALKLYSDAYQLFPNKAGKSSGCSYIKIYNKTVDLVGKRNLTEQILIQPSGYSTARSFKYHLEIILQTLNMISFELQILLSVIHITVFAYFLLGLCIDLSLG